MGKGAAAGGKRQAQGAMFDSSRECFKARHWRQRRRISWPARSFSLRSWRRSSAVLASDCALGVVQLIAQMRAVVALVRKQYRPRSCRAMRLTWTHGPADVRSPLESRVVRRQSRRARRGKLEVQVTRRCSESYTEADASVAATPTRCDDPGWGVPAPARYDSDSSRERGHHGGRTE